MTEEMWRQMCYCDMFCNSLFSDEEMEKEKRGCSGREISMSVDNHEDVVHEKLSEAFLRERLWLNHTGTGGQREEFYKGRADEI